MTNILIFRTDRIGDLIFTCPTIITIKKYFKNSKITLVTSRKNTLFAENLGIFDTILEFPKNNIFKKINFIIHLSKIKFNYVFIFDGKERSILSSIFIKSQYKIALTPKIKLYYKIFNIKFFEDNYQSNLNEIFQKMLFHSKINTKISNYNFLSQKKDNNFSKLLPINNYLHIHLDEKWFNDLYIKTYTNINPNFNDFSNFLNILAKSYDILITTGLIDLDLINQLIDNFFKKKSDKIYFNNMNNKLVYLVSKPSFDDLISLLGRTKKLISCHGSVTHAANSFNIMKIDILEKNKVSFYQRFSSYLKEYKPIFREDFKTLKESIYIKLNI